MNDSALGKGETRVQILSGVQSLAYYLTLSDIQFCLILHLSTYNFNEIAGEEASCIVDIIILIYSF